MLRNTHVRERIIKTPDLTALGDQIIAYEVTRVFRTNVTITAILQTLAHTDPAIRRAIDRAMRDNNKKVPASFLGVQERVEEHIGLVESQIAPRSQH